MNRRVLPLIIGSLFLPLGCGGPSSPPSPPAPSGNDDAPLVLQPSELCSEHPDYAIATFEDADLEAAIRAALSVSAREDLTCDLVSGLTALAPPVSGWRRTVFGAPRLPAPVDPFESLAGIQNLTSLTRLHLGASSITDIGALTGLTSLTFLNLGGNSITDIGALSELTSLTTLSLSDNSITDISTLSGLTSLTALSLSANPVSDISALTGLTSLTNTLLGGNSITDIGALSELTSLMTLSLRDNSITDISALSELTSLGRLFLQGNAGLSNIQPLLDNTGLGAGDTVWLSSTSVSCTDVAALEAKGVTVESDCP